MATAKQNADLLQMLKEQGKIRKLSPEEAPQQQPYKPLDIPFTPIPDVPTYPNAPNPRLRTPMPSVATLQPDNTRQFFNAAIPQTRLLPNIPSSNTFIGSAIQSTVGSSSIAVSQIPPIPPITNDQLFEVNSNAATLGHVNFINGTHT